MTDDVYARETVSIQMMMIYTTAKSKCPERNDYSKYRDATLSGNASAGWVQCSKRRKKSDCGKIFEILPREERVLLCWHFGGWQLVRVFATFHRCTRRWRRVEDARLPPAANPAGLTLKMQEVR